MVRHVESWGVAISFLSALFTSSGLCLQKLHIKQQSNQQNTSSNSANYFRSTLFAAGVCYVAMGLLLKAFYYIMIPQILIAVLSAQTVVFTTILEYLFLNVRINIPTQVCISGVAVGTLLTLLGVAVENEAYSFVTLWEMWLSPGTLLFTAAAVAIIAVISNFFRLRLLDTTDTTSGGSNASTLLKLLYRVLVCGLIAGWFGTLSKAVCEVAAFNVINNDSITFRSMVWFMLLLAFAMGTLKMRSVALALRQFQAWQFLPLYQSAAIFFNALCGLIYFEESPSIDRSFQGRVIYGTYFLGLVVTCASIAGLIFRHNETSDLQSLKIITEDHDGEEATSLLWESANDATSSNTNPVHSYLMKQGGADEDEDAGHALNNNNNNNNNNNRSNHGAYQASKSSSRVATMATTAMATSKTGSTYQILRGGMFFEAYGEDDIGTGSNYCELHDAEDNDDCDEVHFDPSNYAATATTSSTTATAADATASGGKRGVGAYQC